MLKKKSLLDISKSINSGMTPFRKNPKYWKNGTISWLKTEQLGTPEIFETTEKITELAVKETSLKIYPINTLSVAMYGEGKTRGNVSVLKNEMTTNQACCNIVIDEEKANYKYVYYFLKTQYNQLRNLSSGVRKNLNSNDIKQFEIVLPEDISIQKQIASVLSNLDAKIELNNHINRELEQMAKLIYDYWFVQFDFPDINGKPYKSNGGKMVYNKELKREIPEGWEVNNLFKIADFTNGLAMQNFRPENDDFLQVIKIREMREGFTSNSEYARTDIPDKYIVENGDILFSWSASLEVIQWTKGRGGLNQHIFKVTSNNYPKSYYYHQLKNYLNHFKMMAENRKTTMGHITKDHLLQSKIVIATDQIIRKFATIIQPIMDKITINDEGSHHLTTLRDWLLPMLMNGQIRVGEAGKKEYKLNEGEMSVAAEPGN